MVSKALSPLEIQRALVSHRLGKKIHWFETLPSTNIKALSLARQGAEEGEIVIAEEQTQGKGRLGRSWSSPPYLNLYLSLILKPKFPPNHAPQITLMAAVAVADTVRSFIPFTPEIKWPNDILVQGQKIAGILTESSCESGRILFVILGVGVNLNFSKELMSETIRNKATSLLALTQRPVDRQAFTCRLIQSLDRCYGTLEGSGFVGIRRRWEGYFLLQGKKVTVEMPDGQISGKVVGIDMDGALIIEGEGGNQERILAGDVLPLAS